MIFGYNNFEDFLTSLFKGVTSDIIIKYIIPFILLINLAFDFLFASIGGIWFLITLYIIDFLTGVIKATYFSIQIVKLKKANLEVPKEYESKKLVSKKFPRFLFTLLASLIILSLINFAGKFSIIFYPLFSIFYSVFLGQQLISIIENFYEMKLVPLALYKKLKKKITDVINE